MNQSLVAAVLLLLTAPLGASAQALHYSVVRTQMPDGYVLTSIQQKSSAGACRAATAAYAKQVRTSCPQCKIQRERCETSLAGEERALWGNAPLKSYSVSAGDTRLLFSGKSDVTKAGCEQISKEISLKGVPASCVPPGQARK